jgi:hypothetical protein
VEELRLSGTVVGVRSLWRISERAAREAERNNVEVFVFVGGWTHSQARGESLPSLLRAGRQINRWEMESGAMWGISRPEGG